MESVAERAARRLAALVIGVVAALALAAPTSATAAQPHLVLSVANGAYNAGSGVPGYDFVFRGAGSSYGGDFKRVFVWVFDEHGTPVDPSSLSVQAIGVSAVAMTRVREGHYEGTFRIAGATGPTSVSIVATGTVGASPVADSVTLQVGNWGCIDCHGPAYDYGSYYVGFRAIDGVPPTSWMASGCSACHAAGQLMEAMKSLGSVNWPYHAIDRDALDAGAPDAVLGFGTHAHTLEGHGATGCTVCHESYAAGSPHAAVGCAGCHGSLAFSAPSGPEGSYTRSVAFGGPVKAGRSVQQIERYFVVNVPASAATLDVSISWPTSDDFDVYVYSPGEHRAFDLAYGFDGATSNNPESISMPVNGAGGLWLVKVTNYDAGGVGGTPQDPGEDLPTVTVTLAANYPIGAADIEYRDCADCHAGAPSWGADGTNLTHHYRGQGNSVECRACHEDAHDASVDDHICQGCHSAPPAGHPVTGSTYDAMTYSECAACHGSDFHEMQTPSGGGANCVGCHDLTGSAPKKVDVGTMGVGMHATLNAGAANDTGNPLNAACWACHGDGTQPTGGHPATYKQPKRCEDCHANASLFDAPGVASHRYGATFAEVTRTVSSSFPVTGSCLFCHDTTHGAVGSNADPDEGSFDADGDGSRGGSASPYHYGVRPALNGTDSSDCAYCHENEANGERWGGALPFDGIGSLPGHKSAYQRYLDAGGTPTSETVWTYRDAYDAAAKREGGYVSPEEIADCSFCHASGLVEQGGSFHLLASGNTTGPHGGYDSTTNKCKVCHAVHRAEGAYYLLRADTQDDACTYCHIGGTAHSRKIVYDFAGTIYPTNGHSIGASSIIPDSSVKQWLEDVELTTFDEDGTTVTETVEVRRYYERRNKMFRFGRHHGQVATAPESPGSFAGYSRVGPLALRCMNCHQPHNALDMIWMPIDLASYGAKHGEGPARASELTSPTRTGYKLLRASPSGSIANSGEADEVMPGVSAETARIERLPVAPVGAAVGVGSNDVVRVPADPTIGPHNTGEPFTVWTRWPETAGAAFGGLAYRDPSVVTQFALSVWCADCHNLNVGYWTVVAAELGFRSHADRTHPAPYAGAYNGPGQCYSCHRNDLEAGAPGTEWDPWLYRTESGSVGFRACEQCHFGTYAYRAAHRYRSARGEFAYYDFPHSGGATTSVKLLGSWTAYLDENGSMQTTAATITAGNLDAVCKRCHPGIGVRH